MTGPLRDDDVRLPAGLRLALRRADGPGRPFLLVHGLASNARLWDGVGRRLAAAGHEVVAVDLRGHGRSDQPPDGYSTDACADDLAVLCREVGLQGGRAPVVAGQSWGGNVVVSLAARHGLAAGLALVDGGWISLRDRFPTFDECWAAMAPPVFERLTRDQLTAQARRWHPDWPEEGIEGTVANFAEGPDGQMRPRLSREHHRDIVRSLWEGDPRCLYPQVSVPVLLVPAQGEDAGGPHRTGPHTALELLPDVSVAWYEGADHDLHAQQPDRLVRDLLVLAERVEAGRRGGGNAAEEVTA